MNKEKHVLDIIDLGSQGEGIGKLDGLTVFVEDAIPGDKVLIELTQEKKTYAKGRIVELLEASRDRIEAPCIYADECGGCSLQHMDYQAQLSLKENWLKNALERIGEIEDPKILPIIPMEDPWRYRNKAGYAIGHSSIKSGGGVLPASVGFYKKRSHDVVDCDTCLLQVEVVEVIIRALREFIDRNKWLEGITIKTAFGTKEIMIILEVADKAFRKPSRGRSGRGAGKEFKFDPKQISGWLQKALADEDVGTVIEPYEIKSLMLMKDGKVHHLAGQQMIKDRLMGMDFEISANSFYQVNPVQTEKLYDKVREFADLKGQETVLDLYCGVGTIGLILADKAKKVIGIESVKQAVLDANRNATINGIVNIEFIHGRAEEALVGLVGPEAGGGLVGPEAGGGLLGQGVQAGSELVAVLDPPRAGCHPDLLKAVAEAGVGRVVYVSCDPATLARDIKILTSMDYKFEKAQPIDLFPQTNSLEVIALLTK